MMDASPSWKESRGITDPLRLTGTSWRWWRDGAWIL